MSVAWHRFDGLEAASAALADWVAERLAEAVAARGEALLAVPGGRTPARFLALLGAKEIAWPAATLLLTDERLVPPDHPRSNEAMLRASLAPLAAGACRFVPFAAEAGDAEAAAASASARLAGYGPLDVLVSGMGEDAHIASLFPGDARLTAASPLPDVIAAAPEGLEPRLTLSPARLASARHRALLIEGEAKRAVLEAALAGGDAVRTPVALLARDGRTFDIFSG